MNQLYTDVGKLINILEELSVCVVGNQFETYDETMASFSCMMGDVFPRIIASYMKPEFAQVAADGAYWKDQLARILSVMQARDQFQFLDVMLFETKGNLILYQDMIKEMEIDL
ncbi:MAG: hypothetical protein GX567_12790 [Clostridia bacterium]|nr:hypothetical protein [Clostridia bacterium]